MIGSPLRIALVGFSGTALASLELFLNRQKQQYEITTSSVADALIYNADQPVPLEKQQLQYRKDHDKPGVVVSIKDVSWPGMVALKKPYSMASLAFALKELTNQLSIGSESPYYADEQTQQSLEDVVAAYRLSIQRGRGEYNDELNHIKLQTDRRKTFQEKLLARKHTAEQNIKQFKLGMSDEVLTDLAGEEKTDEEILTTLELLPEEDSSSTETSLPASDSSRTTEDIMMTTEAVIAEQTNEGDQDSSEVQESDNTLDSDDSDAIIVSLIPANEQQIEDCCGHSADVNLNDVSQRRRLFFNSEGQLLSLVSAAIKRSQAENSSVAVIGLSNKHLEYHPGYGQFYSNIDFDVLLQMTQVRFRFGELQLQHVSDKDRVLHETDFVHYPANQLLWKIACWSSRGRLIDTVDLDTPYQLSQTPDNSVLIGLPFTEEMVELWQKEPLTAKQVMDQLQAPQRYVFPFMTAAWVLGWLRKPIPETNEYPSSIISALS